VVETRDAIIRKRLNPDAFTGPTVLAEDELIGCNTTNSGCMGGYPDKALLCVQRPQ
jgi:Papain family cysteine protease